MKHLLFSSLMTVFLTTKVMAQCPLLVTVNSNQDLVKPDDQLTLREAIALSNNTLSIAELTPQEAQQVDDSAKSWEIRFQLPPNQGTIRLTEPLPPLQQTGLLLEGTIRDNQPQITLTPAPEAMIPQGLLIVGNEITVRGLSLYGFQGEPDALRGLPAANIVIAPPDDNKNPPPKNVVIEQNWLGFSPTRLSSHPPSHFGIAIFAGVEVTVKENEIRGHQGSGILTMVDSRSLSITNNEITHNGQIGMADGIHLEGKIHGTTIINNQITHNGGSGVFLFNPQGEVRIENNQVLNNSQRHPQAAIFLMGNDHQVIDNGIENPNGSGVVVASQPKSIRNLILNNRFRNLSGLSIDLITRRETTVRAYNNGDGKNPPRNSLNRNLDTANRAIATPEFLAENFYLINNTVYLDGTADPNSEITLYRVGESKDDFPPPLLEPIATTEVDAEGRFSFQLTEVKRGTAFSAIATHPDFGTSEPATPVLIKINVISGGEE